MKKNLLFLVSYILILGSANAQTNVSGFISANTTWNLAGSPYVVVSNALLSHGYTLTIDPGVVVKFNDSTALQIDGELLAIGTATNRITFTSNQTVPAAGDWGKIHFADTCVDAVLDANDNYISGSIMKYCNVMYGGQLGFGEIHIESSSPYFSCCQIRNSLNSGIYSDTSFAIDSSLIKDCLFVGMWFHGGGCGLIIKNDTIENNKGGIIFELGSGTNSCQKKIINNYFHLNNTETTLGLGQSVNVLVSENLFLNNTTSLGAELINLSNNYLVPDNIKFSCNKVLNNQTSGGPIIRGSLAIGGSIINNTIDGNSSSTGYILYGITAHSSIILNFQNNIITNNSSPLNACFYININLGLNFDHNIISGNTGPSALNISGTDCNNFKHNIFSNPSCQYELWNSIPFGNSDISADSNYWGTTSTQHIDSVIYDYFDNANKSVVYYSPILTAPVVIDTTCPPSIITDINNNIEVPEDLTTLFPNPFTTAATLKFSHEVRAATLRVYNLYGQLVLEKNNISGESFRLNAETLGSGIYVYEVTEKEKKICSGKAVVY